MNSINYRNCFLIIFIYFIPVQEVLTFKCLWELLNSGERKTELILFTPDIDQIEPVCENKQMREVTTPDYRTNNTDEKHENISYVASEDKNIRIQLNNNITEDERTQHTSFGPFVDNTTLGVNSINFLRFGTFLQISVAETALVILLLISTRYYVLNIENFRDQTKVIPHNNVYPEKDEANGSNSCNDEMYPERIEKIESNAREDARHPERVEGIGSNSSDDLRYPENVKESESNFSDDVRHPERIEEIASNFSNDELSWITSSTMVLSHLENLVNEIKASKTEESLEKYLPEDFLQSISQRIAEDGFMRSNFQKLLTAERLLMLGEFYYQRNTSYANSQQDSSYFASKEIPTQHHTGNLRGVSHLASNETATQHCTGNLQDVRMNLELKIGGQEFKIVI